VAANYEFDTLLTNLAYNCTLAHKELSNVHTKQLVTQVKLGSGRALMQRSMKGESEKCSENWSYVFEKSNREDICVDNQESMK